MGLCKNLTIIPTERFVMSAQHLFPSVCRTALL